MKLNSCDKLQAGPLDHPHTLSLPPVTTQTLSTQEGSELLQRRLNRRWWSEWWVWPAADVTRLIGHCYVGRWVETETPRQWQLHAGYLGHQPISCPAWILLQCHPSYPTKQETWADSLCVVPSVFCPVSRALMLILRCWDNSQVGPAGGTTALTTLMCISFQTQTNTLSSSSAAV